MVSLTKSRSVEHLLANFRPTVADGTTSLTPGAVMPATEDANPPPQAQEVVLYQPPSQHATRSQSDRLARADAGDLQARLELITVEAAEEALAQRFCKQQPDRSILSFLREPDNGLAPYEAASAVLEELADQTEGTALESAMVFRYIQAHDLWKGHPDPDVRSVEDLVKNLDGSDYIRANIIIGTSAQATKRNCIRLIDGAWGAGWFDKIPADMRDPTWSRAEGCSKRMLTHIAANAKQGISMTTAIAGWSRALQERNDYGARRRLGIKSKASPYLIPNDVASLNTGALEGRRGKRTSEIWFPKDAKEDHLRVELVPPPSTTTLRPEPDSAETATSKPATKRKRTHDSERSGAVPEFRGSNDWKQSADGKYVTKRVRNHRIRKPIEEIPETDSEHSSSPPLRVQTSLPPQLRIEEEPSQRSTMMEDDTSQPSTPAPRADEGATSKPRECQAPAFAMGLQRLIVLCRELNDPAYVATKCCDNCRDPTMEAVKCLINDLGPVVKALDCVAKHYFGNEEVGAAQHYSTLPFAPGRPRRSTLSSSDDPDDD